METQERICRLCLKINDNFKPIEGDMKEVLEKLLPKIDLVASQESVMCTNCAEMLKKCSGFKVTCRNIHDYTFPFLNKENIKLDLKDVYVGKNENGMCVPEDHVICGFCISPVQNCSAISLDGRRDIILQTMIEKCLPELDLSIIKKPVICVSCHGILENCFRFVSNCLIVEEKIKEYCRTQRINTKGQIDLSSLLEFTTSNTSEMVDVIKVENQLIKVENQLCEENQNVDEKQIGNESDMFCDDNVNVKEEVEDKCFMDMDDMKEQFTTKSMLTCKEESNNLDVIKTEETFCGENEFKKENLVDMEAQKLLLNEDIEIKTDEPEFVRLEDGVVLQQPEVSTVLTPNLEEDQWKPYIKQTVMNKNVSNIKTYQCGFCPFQTKYKRNLNIHLLRHKDPSEVTMYKCDFCPFQTKHERNLKNHQILHKSPSEVTMYKCDSCLYETKHKYSLKKHVILHKNPSEVIMYKCDSCLYETKHKYDLKKHLVLHKNLAEVTMYKCESCRYETKHKYSLKKHMILHKNSSEVTMYTCESCAYQTKFKDSLKRHMILHKNPSEVTMYKCDSCPFETKLKGNLKKHLILHKNPSEVTMFKCDSCPFQTKQKCHLKSHQVIHKNPSEVTVYKCDSCLYQTKHKNCLKNHLLVHKNSSEVTMYKCDSCLYQTKYKRCLKAHLLKYKESSHTSMLRCETCSFQTKSELLLKYHLPIHKDPS